MKRKILLLLLVMLLAISVFGIYTVYSATDSSADTNGGIYGTSSNASDVQWYLNSPYSATKYTLTGVGIDTTTILTRNDATYNKIKGYQWTGLSDLDKASFRPEIPHLIIEEDSVALFYRGMRGVGQSDPTYVGIRDSDIPYYLIVEPVLNYGQRSSSFSSDLSPSGGYIEAWNLMNYMQTHPTSNSIKYASGSAWDKYGSYGPMWIRGTTINAYNSISEEEPEAYRNQYKIVGTNQGWGGYRNENVAIKLQTYQVEVYQVFLNEAGVEIGRIKVDERDVLNGEQTEYNVKNGENVKYSFPSIAEYNNSTFEWTHTKINPGEFGPGLQNGGITVNGCNIIVEGFYKINRDTHVYIHMMLDTIQHDAGSQYCIDYTNNSRHLNYNSNGYEHGVKTIEVERGGDGEFPLVIDPVIDGKRYTLINSYYQNPGSAKQNHTGPEVTTKSLKNITENVHIVVEYKLPTSKVNVWCVKDTEVHGSGSSYCVDYKNTAKRIFSEPEEYDIEVGVATKIPLQQYITDSTGHYYELINSHLDSNNYHIGPDSPAFLERNIIIAENETVNITAEYKLSDEPDPEGKETTYTLERLNPLFSAQIMSDSRNQYSTLSALQGTNETTQKYNVLHKNGEYYGIPTSETQYAQLLTASRNLFTLVYVKHEGSHSYEVTINKNYPYLWWSGCFVVKGCYNTTTFSNNAGTVDSSSVADGYVDDRWRHDEINVAKKTTYRSELDSGCYGGTYVDSDGRVHGKGGEYTYGGDCCSWAYRCNNLPKNYCPGHTATRTEAVACTSECPEDCEGGHTKKVEYTWYHDVGEKCQHVHKASCIRYDVCNGHADKWCTNTKYWCNSSCPGHTRQYHATIDPQCEYTSSCIHESTYTVSRTYKYKRSFEYYYVKNYDAYKLGDVQVSNKTLGNAGSVTLRGVNYSIANIFYRPNETGFNLARYGSNQWEENGHVMKPISTHTATHNFNDSNSNDEYVKACTSNVRSNAATGKANYNSPDYAKKEALKQAAWDLGYGGNISKINATSDVKIEMGYTKDDYEAVTNDKMKNDIWMLGETKTVLRVRNDYLWHDGLIMEMYRPTSYFSYNSETTAYGTDNMVDTNNTPSTKLYDFTEFGKKYAYYMTNRTDIIATGKNPNRTVPADYTSGRNMIGSKTDIRNIGRYSTFNINKTQNQQIRYNLFVAPTNMGYTTVKSGTEYALGWGTLANGASGYLWYQNGVLIPKTVQNNEYASYATATYNLLPDENISLIRAKNVPTTGTAQPTIVAGSTNVNSVVVHTPVYISAKIQQGAVSTQVIDQKSELTPLELDKEYTIVANTNGMNRANKYGRTDVSQSGYGTKDYLAWVKLINGNRMIQAHFPYDVYVKNAGGEYTFVKKGTWMTFPNNSNTLTFKIPVWTIEKEYSTENLGTGNDAAVLENTIVVRVVAENDPEEGITDVIGRRYANKEGNTSTSQNILYNQISYDYRAYDAINTNIVGKVYDFKFEYTDDSAYDATIKKDFFGLYADELPFAQKGDNPERPSYQYALRLGYKFKYTLKTKGTKSEEIKIIPSVYYVAKNSNELKPVNVYYEVDGNKYEQLTSETKYGIDTNVTKAGELPYVPTQNILNTQKIYEMILNDELIDENTSKELATKMVTHNYNSNVKIGTLGKVLLNEYVRIRFDDSKAYSEEKVYGNRSARQIKNDAEEFNFIKSISQWYGEFRLPSTVLCTDPNVDGGKLYNTNTGKRQNISVDGYLVVFFNIETLDIEGTPYLSYQLPTPANDTQWGKEGYKSDATGNYTIVLPNGKSVKYTTPDSTKCAPVAIYEALINKDGNVVGPN